MSQQSSAVLVTKADAASAAIEVAAVEPDAQRVPEPEPRAATCANEIRKHAREKIYANGMPYPDHWKEDEPHRTEDLRRCVMCKRIGVDRLLPCESMRL